MRNLTVPATLALFLLLLCGGCIKFDNAAEESDGSGGGTSYGAKVNVEVTGVDNRATVVIVELVWYEGGAEGDTRYMRMAEPSLTGTLNVSFSGLPAGSGYAQAGTFIGNIPWQNYGKSIRIEIGDDLKPQSVSIALSEPDGDVDLDFEFTVEDYPELESEEIIETDFSEETELEEAEETESDIESDYEDFFRPLIFVPYSPISMIPDGVVDPLDEWEFAETYQFQTYHQWPTTVYIMHDSRYLYIGMIVNNVPSSDEGDDRVRIYFDLDTQNDGNAFNLYITKKKGTKGCEPVNLNSCLNLPYGQPVWDAQTSLFADGYQAEFMISFQSLGLVKNVAKRLGFASASQDNGYLHFWPQGSEPDDVTTWGYADSLDDWGEHFYPDGDEETEIETEEEIDTIDVDIADGDNSDGDTDTDPDPDVTDTDPETFSCTPNDTVCVLELGVYKAKTCNGSGNGWDLVETCVDDNECTDNSCQNHTGCIYPVLEYFDCNDSNPCTTDDYCDTDGQCTGHLLDCVDDNPCTIDWQNPANPECCQHDWKTVGQGCDDGLICTSGTSCQPVSPGSTELQCVGTTISGCCEGRPGMVLTSTGICIDKYEAVAVNNVYYNGGTCNGSGGTRYGLGVDDYASGGLQDDGTASGGQTLYACQVAQIIPSTNLTKHQAETLCENAGKRLCGKDEWESICSNTDVNTYPYGDNYQATYCNGADFTPANDNVVQTGLLNQCLAPGNIYDLSGNVQEWTSDTRLCGGSSVSTGSEMTCTSCNVPPENAGYYTSPQTGFRCCAVPIYP